MSIDITRMSAKELGSLINEARKRKTTLSKRKPLTVVRKKPVEVRVCNTIAMQIEDARLQRSTAAQADAELEQRQRRDAQVKAQLEQQQRREAQVKAQLEQQQRQQQLQANAAAERREIEGMTQQLNQMGQQWRDFGNSVQPRTTNCTRTTMGANCISY